MNINDETWEFKTEYGDIYKRDNRARESLNKLLETEYKAVFRHERNYKKQWNKKDTDWSSEDFFVLTKTDRVIKFSNSEWAYFKEVVK